MMLPSEAMIDEKIKKKEQESALDNILESEEESEDISHSGGMMKEVESLESYSEKEEG